MSTTNDFYSAPDIQAKPRRKTSLAKSVLRFLVFLCLTPIVLFWVFIFLMAYSIDSRNTEGPAPEGSYAIRRAWGEEKLRHHFRAAEEWIHESSQIAKHVGAVNGVAPIGAPNSFGASFGESWAALNLQVLGDKGEGVLCLPHFSGDSSNNPYGFEDASWTFADSHYPVLQNGKSWLEEYGLDSLYEQVFEFAEQGDHRNVVKTCRALEEALVVCEAEEILSAPNDNIFSSVPSVYRSKLVEQFADSLAKTSNYVESADLYVEIAASGLTQLLNQQQAYRGPKPKKKEVAVELKDINTLLRKAQALEPNKDSVLKLASWRSLLAYQNQKGTMLFESEDLDSERRQQLIRRELKGMFEYAERLAKKSPYLRAALGTVTTRPRVGSARLPEEAKIFWSGLPIEFASLIPNNTCEDYCTLHRNPDGRYQSYIGLDIEGANGKTGRLSLFVQERNLDESQRDLFLETPRDPSNGSSSNFTASWIRWKEKGKRSIKISPRTLNRMRKQ